jgi:hypothetical protein
MNRQAVFASSWSISFCHILVFASFGCEGDGEADGFEAGVGDGGFWEVC